MCTVGCVTRSPHWTTTGAEPYVARRRLDAELVRRNLARSREHAGQLIAAGRVTVGGTTATKAATQVETGAAVVVAQDGNEPDYVSRGGHKLEAALDSFGVSPAGLVCLDVGASTGGFTDVLLGRGASRIFAIDVGRGQLADRLRRDPRVVSMERTNARRLGPDVLPEPVTLAVVDHGLKLSSSNLTA